MRKLIILLLVLFSINTLNSQEQTQTKSGKVIRDVGNTGKKIIKKIKELFAVKHKIPKDYLKMEGVELISIDSLNNITPIKNKEPSISLKLLYPRITPAKGFFSFHLGDFNYFKYVKNIKLSDIEYIKLISEDGTECFVDKFDFIKKESPKRHFSFLLDHSGSMGRKRASILQQSLYNAIEKDISLNNNSSYYIYKFSEKNKMISSGNTLQDIKSGFLPVNGLKGFGGGTAIKDALLTGIKDLMKVNKYEFKLLVLFTDGDSNSDIQQIPMSEVLLKAKENNINIVSVAFGSYLDIGYLNDIAENSGGSLFHIYDTDEFEILFDNVFKDVDVSYNLEFVPCIFGNDVTIEMKLISNNSSFIGKTVFRTPLSEGYSIDLNILFEIGSSKLQANNNEKLDALVNIMNFEKKLEILIEGHSDRIGNESNNIKLSKERALSVKKYLTNKGILSNRIKTKGYGSSKPAFEYKLGSNKNRNNRRIQVVILKN